VAAAGAVAAGIAGASVPVGVAVTVPEDVSLGVARPAGVGVTVSRKAKTEVGVASYTGCLVLGTVTVVVTVIVPETPGLSVPLAALAVFARPWGSMATETLQAKDAVAITASANSTAKSRSVLPSRRPSIRSEPSSCPFAAIRLSLLSSTSSLLR
jgi:hypothetical protein